MGWLDGNVALVTGGGSGIGRAVVDRFLHEGCTGVGVLLRDEEQGRSLCDRYAGQVCVTYGDVRSGESNRSEERRVGKEWVSTCRSRGAPDHSKKKKTEE